ncbi:MAG: hypothetical protein ACKO0W_02875 [Planctomycetota bacterium]
MIMNIAPVTIRLFATVATLAACISLTAAPSAPPGGPEMNGGGWIAHANKLCVEIPPCPGWRNQPGVFGSSCDYCERTWPQGVCQGVSQYNCQQNEFRRGASTCGVRTLGGQIDANGNCIGGTASGICYRVACAQEAPQGGGN